MNLKRFVAIVSSLVVIAVVGTGCSISPEEKVASSSESADRGGVYSDVIEKANSEGCVGSKARSTAITLPRGGTINFVMVVTCENGKIEEWESYSE